MRRQSIQGLVLLAVGALVAAGCASSGNSSSGTSSAGGSSAGTSSSTVNMMAIASWNNPDLDTQDMTIILQNEAKYLNAHGGLGPEHDRVNMIACNDSFDVNGAVSCGRQAVSDHVVAMIGFSEFDSAFLPLTDAAHIVRTGGDMDAGDNASPETFVEIAGTFLAWGPIYLAASQCKSVAWLYNAGVTGPLSATDKAYYEGAFKAAGNPNGLATVVNVPASTSDMTPYLVQAENAHPDCIYADLFTTGLDQLIQAETAQGVQGKYAIYTDEPGTLPSTFLAQNATQTEGWKTMSFYQIPSQNKAWADYVTRMDSFNDLGAFQQDLTNTAEQQAEVSWWTIVNAAKTIKGPITGASLTTALSNSCNLSTNGLTPNVDFCHTLSYNNIQRQFYEYMTEQVVHDGKLEPLNGGSYINMISLWQKGGSNPIPADAG